MDHAAASETILLVEDEKTLRELISETMKKLGYTVLLAANGAEAVQIAEQYSAPIPLLITDVVMPQMSGPELAQMLRASRPGIQVLYMSGYTDNKLQSMQTSDPNTPLIQKPFRLGEFTLKVRDVLSRPIPAPQAPTTPPMSQKKAANMQ